MTKGNKNCCALALTITSRRTKSEPPRAYLAPSNSSGTSHSPKMAADDMMAANSQNADFSRGIAS